MLNLATDIGGIVNQRLKDENVDLATTPPPQGTPQPNPGWFYWDEENIIVYSKPDFINPQHTA